MSFSVVRALGLCTVQDLGRPGRMHEAVPPGGALVAERLVAANRAAGNPDDAPALEILGQLAIRAERSIEIATDVAPARPLAAGGGSSSPASRSGRLPRRAAASRPRSCSAAAAPAPPTRGPFAPASASPPTRRVAPAPERRRPRGTPIRLIAVRHRASSQLYRALSSEYRILPSSKRVGTRPRARRCRAATPWFRADGARRDRGPARRQPIVLGPEHPTTGYP
jgi:allophanate hydrolase subunit 2